MALRFRRGSDSQKSGSLQFGEPYVNTDLNTLQIGGLGGDITLSAVGTGSNLLINDITASNMKLSGNANIAGDLTLGGNITIGNQTSDVINVVASLSSSLIPEVNNTFNLGSPTKAWKELYVSTGSINFVDGSGNVVGTLTSNASGDLNISGAFSASTYVGFGNATDFSSSLDGRIKAATNEQYIAGFATTSSLNSLSSSVASTDATQTANITTAQNSANGAFASASAYSASAASALSSYSSSVASTDGVKNRYYNCSK